jgi:hypothetical protein
MTSRSVAWSGQERTAHAADAAMQLKVRAFRLLVSVFMLLSGRGTRLGRFDTVDSRNMNYERHAFVSRELSKPNRRAGARIISND